MPAAPATDGDALLPAYPVSRLRGVAALAPPSEVSAYKPHPSDHALAGALYNDNPATLQALADASGISISTIGRVLENPARAAWIFDRSCQAAFLQKGELIRVIVQRAKESKSSAWAKLAMEVVDPEFRRGSLAAAGNGSGQVNNQYNFIGSLSDEELQAMAGQLLRRQLGCQNQASPACGPK